MPPLINAYKRWLFVSFRLSHAGNTGTPEPGRQSAAALTANNYHHGRDQAEAWHRTEGTGRAAPIAA
jgi:hypothetical protein